MPNSSSAPLSAGKRLKLAIAIRDALQELPHEDAYLTLVQFDVIGPDEENLTTGEQLIASKDRTLVELSIYLGLPLEGDETLVDPSARQIDAYAELVAAETAFRWVVRSCLAAEWRTALGSEAVENLERKVSEEDRRRDGVNVSRDLLDYLEAHQLEVLINNQDRWKNVKPVLDDFARTRVYLGIMLDVRNAIAHARPIAPAEKLLLAGVAGQVQNQISRYRSNVVGPQAHYAVINYVRDSFGEDATNHYGSTPPRSHARLEVGQVVTLECSGSDPRARSIEWDFDLWSSTSAQPPVRLGTSSEREPKFRWHVAEAHVGEARRLTVSVRNSSEYLRLAGCDETVSLMYDINPPRS